MPTAMRAWVHLGLGVTSAVGTIGLAACGSTATVGVGASTDAAPSATTIHDAGQLPDAPPRASSDAARLLGNDGGPPPTDSGGTCTQTLIYLIATDAPDAGPPPSTAEPTLYRFDPSTATLTAIGPIPCLAGTQLFTGDVTNDCWSAGGPFYGGCGVPMAIDTTRTAWVFLPTGPGAQQQVMQRVDVTDATCIGASTPVQGLSSPQSQFVGGSAFASSGGTEKLYVSVATWDQTDSLQLGVFDPPTSTVTQLSTVTGLPAQTELWWWGTTLTPNGHGDLYMTDFWGGPTQSLLEIDPTTTTVTNTSSLPPSLWSPYDQKVGAIVAFWNDSLYFFMPDWAYYVADQAMRPVTKYGLADASVTTVTSDLGVYVLGAASGAGCAPATPDAGTSAPH
jgi:hypothetical protein